MNQQEKIQEYIPLLIERLKTKSPKKIILFGSYAINKISEESDLDILIVLNSNRIPETYDEKINLKLEIRRAIRDINKKIPIDILVYTIPEYESFLNSGSSFLREIEKSGKIVYEAAS